MNMSFSEKSAWISFFSILGVFGYYFFQVAGLSDLPLEEGKDIALTLLFRALIFIVILESVLNGLLAAGNRKGAELGGDERDQLIELKANKRGYVVLSTVVMIVIGRLLLLEYNPQFTDAGSSLDIPMLTAHMLMFGFFIAELVRFGWQILAYRSEE